MAAATSSAWSRVVNGLGSWAVPPVRGLHDRGQHCIDQEREALADAEVRAAVGSPPARVP